MKFLSLHEIEHTQGTVQLIDHGGHLQVKKGTDIVLVPQPNRDDPNDPLNWSRRKRITTYDSILVFAGLTNFGISGISPDFEQLAEEFGSSIDQLTYLISATGLGMTMGCFTVAPLAVRFGKRPIWLGCMTVFFVCLVWVAASQSYASLLVARLLASWAGVTSEPLSLATLNDLFFLHERGTQSGAMAMALSFGNLIAPIAPIPATRRLRLRRAQSDAEIESKPGVIRLETKDSNAPSALPKQRTYLEELKPWSGPRGGSLLAAYMRPWAMWTYPTFAWGVLSFSLHVTVVVVFISLLPRYFVPPPYSFSSSQLGFTYIGPLIGNFIGMYACGYLNDVLSQFSARRNHGVFEPEMRLPVMVIPAVLGPAGLIMFGVGVARQTHWIVPLIGNSLVGVALTGLPSFVQPYLMDSYYPPIPTNSSYVNIPTKTFNGTKNLIFFGIGFAIVPWVKQNGLIAVFCILAAILFVVDLGAVVVYLFGKRARARDGRLRIFPS